MNTTPERWRRIEELIDAVLDLPTEERAAWLRSTCGADDELYEDLMQLLEGGERADAFLNSPIVDLAAGLGAHIIPPPTPARTPTRVGPWRIVKELGQGGMGSVYLAEREEHFQQRVALKLIRRGLHGDDHLVRRFIEERQMLASLQHANIAHVLDGGITEDDIPWFAMEFVEGQPIDRWCDAHRLSIEARLELFRTVCDAVEYAHQRQIIHRDLKPSNILVRADGVPKLLDFGVAKLLANEGATGNLTRTGFRLLTPEYASPEQIRGDPVSPQSDVYSLGVLLYELLTGRRPYRVTGRASREVEQAVLTQEPTRPSTAVRSEQAQTAGASPMPSRTEIARARGTTAERLSDVLRGELDEIVLKALSKEPKRRYSSAQALSLDVQRYLDGLPVRVGGRMRARLRAAAVATLLLVVIAAGTALWPRVFAPSASFDDPAVVAVGLISDFRDEASAEPARALADLLATNLARVPPLQIVSTARLYEVMAELGTGAADAGSYSAAARRAGATLLLDGGLFRIGDGRLRLDLRRTDVATGNVLGAESIFGNDVFTLVDGATAWLASAVDATRPEGSVADVTTHSEAAYRFYEAGMRAFYNADLPAARGLLEAALAEDSALAMAAYYLSRADPARSGHYREQALRLAPRASERERLIIESEYALNQTDPVTAVAKAETLAIRYPQEVTGHYVAGRALIAAGDFARGLERLQNLLVMDSAMLAGTNIPCRRCDARATIIEAYIAIDSLPAAERAARAWSAIQPRAVSPWLVLSEVLILQGKRDAGRAAYREAAAIEPALDNRSAFLGMYHIAEREYDALDTRLRELLKSTVPDYEGEAYLYLSISLRNQGRLGEALDIARRVRAHSSSRVPQAPSAGFAMHEAQVLQESGRYREAAALFDTIAHLGSSNTPARLAAARAMWLVRVARAFAAMNDTPRLAQLADTIRILGARSSWTRDQRMHHYARGLLLARQNKDEEAIAEFRRAIIAPMGDVSVQYELARSLLRLGRAREAVATLNPLMHARLLTVASTMTYTELQELLAQAWDAAGEPDSALVHYRAVAHAWQRADPFLRPRIAAVRARVSALDSLRSRK